MLILKSLQLKNFLSHADTSIEFEENTKLSIEGVSGSGKSSIVESILWNLFGKGRADNRSLIKRGAKNASVALEMEDNGTLYRITRGVSEKGKQTIDLEVKTDMLGYQPISKTGLKDSQDYIEKELLKSSYLLFINSVIYPQDNVESFVKQTAGKRKELLLEIVGAENYDLYYTRAKSLASVTAEGLTRLSAELENIKKNRDESYHAAVQLMDFQMKAGLLEEELKEIEQGEKVTNAIREQLTSLSHQKRWQSLISTTRR